MLKNEGKRWANNSIGSYMYLELGVPSFNGALKDEGKR